MSGWAAAIQAVSKVADTVLGQKFATHSAKKNYNFQRDMSSTSYQRSMADMRAAGLNPMLAYQQGGASTPPGGAAALVQSRLGEATNSAMETRRLAAEIKNLNQMTANIDADTMKKYEEAFHQNASALAALQSEKTLRAAETANYETASKTRAEGQAIQFDNERRRAEAQFYETEAGEKIRNLGIIRDNLGGLIPLTSGSSARSRR